MAQPNQKSRWFNYCHQPSCNLPYNTPIQCKEACCHTIKCPAPYRPYVQWQYNVQEPQNDKFLHSKMFDQSSLNYMPVSTYLQHLQIESPVVQPDYTTECHNISRLNSNYYDNSNVQNNEDIQSNSSHSQVSRDLQKLDVRQFLATWKDDDESNETTSNIIGQEINACKCPTDSYQSYHNEKNQSNLVASLENSFRDIGLFGSEHDCQAMAFHKQNVQQVDYDLPRNLETKKRKQQSCIIPPNDCYYSLQDGHSSSNFVSSYNNNNFKNLSNMPYSSEHKNSRSFTKVTKKRLEVPYERTIEKVWNPNINNYSQYKNGEATHLDTGNQGVNNGLYKGINSPKYGGFKIGNEKSKFYPGFESGDLFNNIETNQNQLKDLFQPACNHHDYRKKTTKLTHKSEAYYMNVKPILHNILTGQESIETFSDSTVVPSFEPRACVYLNNSTDSIKCGCCKIGNCKMTPSFPDRICNYSFEPKNYEANKKFSSSWELMSNDDTHLKKCPESDKNFSKIKNDNEGSIHNNKLNNLKKDFQDIFLDEPVHSSNSGSSVVSEKNKFDETTTDFFICNHHIPTIEPIRSGEVSVSITKEIESTYMLQNNGYPSNNSGMFSNLYFSKSIIENNCTTNTQHTSNYTDDDKFAAVCNTTKKTISVPNHNTKVIVKPLSTESVVEKNLQCSVDKKQNKILKKRNVLCNKVSTNIDLKSKTAIEVDPVDDEFDSESNQGGQNMKSVIKISMKCSEKDVFGVHKTNNYLERISFIFKDINILKHNIDTYLKLCSEHIKNLSNLKKVACEDISRAPLPTLKTLTNDCLDINNKKYKLINDIIKRGYLNATNIQLSFKKIRSEANKCTENTFMNGFNSRSLPTIKSEKCTYNNVKLNSEIKKTNSDMTLEAYKTSDPKKSLDWKILNKAHFLNRIIKININEKMKYLKPFKLTVRSRKKCVADKIVTKYKNLKNQFIHKRHYPNRLKCRVENTILKPSIFSDKNKAVCNIDTFLNNEYCSSNVQVKDKLVIILDGITDDHNTDSNKNQKSQAQFDWMDIYNKNDRHVLESASNHLTNTKEDINDEVTKPWSYQDTSFERKNTNSKLSSGWDQIFNLKPNQSKIKKNTRPAKLELLFGTDEKQEQWQIIDQYNDNCSKLLKVKRLIIRRKTVPKKRVPKVVIQKTKGQKYRSFIKEFEMQPTVMLEHCSHLDEMAVERVHAKFICRSCYFPFNSQEALNDHHCRKEGLYCI